VIVVADTSVILNICLLKQERLLLDLFGEVIAPPEVKMEFQRLADSDTRFMNLEFPDFINCLSPKTQTYKWADSPVLHAGEIAAISLALDLQPDLLLMDEAEGRAVAVSLNLATMGLLGILIRAQHESLIASVAPFLDRLDTEARFWMTPSLRAAVLKAAGESA
jgi:predicted nucleic acid-binding protein